MKITVTVISPIFRRGNSQTTAKFHKTKVQLKMEFLKYRTNFVTRVEVLSKNNVRFAVNSGEKNFFHRKARASFSVECAESGEFL